MKQDIDTISRGAYEKIMINLKEADSRISDKISASSEKKVWNSMPEWIRKSKTVEKMEGLYLNRKGKGEYTYARICMMSFVNYMLNKKLVVPVNADSEYIEGLKRVMETFTAGAAGRQLAWDTLYEKELYSKITRKDGYYEFEGKKLTKKMFAPEVFLHHHGLKMLPSEIVEEIKIGDILDIGAAMGDSATVLSGYTYGNVYSFECNEANYKELLETIKINGLKNIKPMMDAVGRSDGKLEFDGFPRDRYFHYEPKHTISIKTRTIDSLCQENKIKKVSLIKMDIEGFELEALEGGRKTIERDKPMIIASVYHTGKDFFEIPLYLEKINPNYRFKLLFLNDEPPTKEVNLVAY